MRLIKKIFLILFLLNPLFVFSQKHDNFPDSLLTINYSPSAVEKTPSFPGGDLELFEFIRKNLSVSGVGSGRSDMICYAKFTVSKTGKLKHIKILRNDKEDDKTYNKEAVRVIKKMPNWIPGEQHGKKISVECTLPIKFHFGSLL
ncbi:MAG: hypothetical protein EPN85_01320 [Bacteroidetes bacterium]|nr:MAG: hypothetical protein EPN85_01320 [Bacteroidota bacterium]